MLKIIIANVLGLWSVFRTLTCYFHILYNTREIACLLLQLSQILVLFFLWSFINSHCAKSPGIPAAIRMSSQLHDQDVCSHETSAFAMRKGFELTFPSTAYNASRFSESRLSWLLNTTLGDPWQDRQRDKDVPVLRTTTYFSWVLGSRGWSCSCRQWSISWRRGAGREEGIFAGCKEVLAYYLSLNPRAKSGTESTYIKLDFVPEMISGI